MKISLGEWADRKIKELQQYADYYFQHIVEHDPDFSELNEPNVWDEDYRLWKL